MECGNGRLRADDDRAHQHGDFGRIQPGGSADCVGKQRQHSTGLGRSGVRVIHVAPRERVTRDTMAVDCFSATSKKAIVAQRFQSTPTRSHLHDVRSVQEARGSCRIHSSAGWARTLSRACTICCASASALPGVTTLVYSIEPRALDRATLHRMTAWQPPLSTPRNEPN